MALPPQTSRPTTEPNRNGMDAAAYLETQRRLNELQGELLNYREKAAERSFNGLVIILTLVGIILALAGYVGFEKFDEIRDEISQHADEAKDEIRQHVGEAERLVSEIEKERKKAVELTAEIASKNPKESARTVASVQRDPTASLIDKAIASAVQLQQQGNIEEAIEKWRSIANVVGEEDHELEARAWFSIGYLRSVGEGIDLEAAIDAYTKAIELNPADAVAYYNRGNAKHDLDRLEEAIADYDRAIELNPANAVAYTNRGGAKAGLGRREEAIADYDRAIELNPANAVAYTNRGGAKHDLDRLEEAIADYDRAIELNPANAAAYYTNRGNAKAGLDRLEEAIADYDRAIELNPANAAPYTNRGRMKQRLGRINEARADYQKALALAQEAGDENLVAMVKDALCRLDNNEEP